jgi:hypothetical protein
VYVFATGWQPTPFKRFSEKVQAEGGWDHHDSEASHFVMADQPAQLLGIMLELAS